MDISLVLQFIKPEIMIIVVACYALGLFLKSSRMSDWLIPFVLLPFAIILAILYMAIIVGDGFTANVLLTGFIQGLLAAALSVYGNQLIKQAIEGLNKQ